MASSSSLSYGHSATQSLGGQGYGGQGTPGYGQGQGSSSGLGRSATGLQRSATGVPAAGGPDAQLSVMEQQLLAKERGLNLKRGGKRLELTEEEDRSIAKMFASFDRQNKDGVLDSVELTDMLVKLTGTSDSYGVQLLFDEIDKDGNGKIDAAEFREVMKQHILGLDQDATLAGTFRVFDPQGTGYVKTTDLREWLVNMGDKPLTYEEADDACADADKNGEGIVNYREYIKSLHPGA